MRLSLISISVRIPLPIPKNNATSFLNGYTKATRPQAASNWSLSVMASLVLCRLCSLKCTLFLLLQRVLTILFFFVLPIYVVSGFIKFLGPYYMLVITERREIGEICGHRVHEVSKSEIFLCVILACFPTLQIQETRTGVLIYLILYYALFLFVPSLLLKKVSVRCKESEYMGLFITPFDLCIN